MPTKTPTRPAAAPTKPLPSTYEVLRTALMKEQGIRQTTLRKRWDKTGGFVSHLLAGRTRSLTLEQDLAVLLGVPVGRIFPPHRFDTKYNITREPAADAPPADTRR